MRNTLLVGVSLAVSAVVVLTLSSVLDLELEAFALVGLAAGAVVAQAASRSPFNGLAGFVAGVVLAWIVYLLRANFLPDNGTGLTIGVAVVLLLASVLAAVSRGRLPLWSVLLGVAALAGSYELTFSGAPDDFYSTSFTAISALLVTAAAGYFAGSLFDLSEQPANGRHRDANRDGDLDAQGVDGNAAEPLSIDDLMTTNTNATTEATR